MTRTFDVFMLRDEMDLLECRLTELEGVPNLVHVIVEADVTHGGNKPREYVYPDHRARFEPWADRICYVQASGLPDTPDAWDREHAQREWGWQGLKAWDADPDDIVLHGDLDEIPTALAARWVKPRGFVRFRQTLYCFALDWKHPEPWWGTVAGRVRDIGRFSDMRDARCHFLPEIEDGGWHLSYMGSHEDNVRKIEAFCHPEVTDILDAKFGSWERRLLDCYEKGWHVDGAKLIPVDVDDTYPRWIREGHAPANWYRP